MRIRSIVPGFFTSESMGDVTRDCRLLFVGLWAMADKNGCLAKKLKKIKAEVFPYDDDVTSEVLQKWLQSLSESGSIEFYIEEPSGQECIYIPNFTKHQKLTTWERRDSVCLVNPPANFRSTSEELQKYFRSSSLALPSEERRGEETLQREGLQKDFSSTAEELQKYGKLFDVLAGTGKFADSFSVEHVAQAMRAAPAVDPTRNDFIDGCRLEASGIVHKVGAAMPWLAAMFVRVCERLDIRAGIVMAGEAGPKKRRFTAVTAHGPETAEADDDGD